MTIRKNNSNFNSKPVLIGIILGILFGTFLILGIIFDPLQDVFAWINLIIICIVVLLFILILYNSFSHKDQNIKS